MTESQTKPFILITGVGGLIGDEIAKTLSSKYSLIGIDRNPENNPDLEAYDCEYIQGDLTDDASLQRGIDKVREMTGGRLASVVHLAAYYDFTGEPSPLYETLTVEGTRRLLRSLQTLPQVEQFIFSSSLLAMKPNNTPGKITEEDPLEGKWAYPQSKIRAEEAIRREHGNIPAVIVRLSGVYDEQGHSLPLGQQISRIYEKQLESYFFPGNAEHGQSVVHLEDLADLFLRLVDRRHELADLEVFLASEPDLMTYNELQDRIGELIHGDDWPTIRIPKFAAKAGAYVMDKFSGDEKSFIKPWMIDLADDHYEPDITKARTLLDWNPQHRLRNTLPEIISYLKQDPAGFYKKNYLPPPDSVKKAEKKAEKK